MGFSTSAKASWNVAIWTRKPSNFTGARPFDTTVVLLSLGFFEVNDAKHGDFRVSLAE
jgi:hypothetical protein